MPGNPKILFVDDEESILSSAQRLFRGKGPEILVSSSPIEALSVLEKESIWVVVSDHKMPGMSGTQFLEKVKKNFPHITRLMLTGYLEFPVLEEAVNRANVFRFISKPWEETELLLAVDTAIQNYERRQENNDLLSKIGRQNDQLETLTRNLEGEVYSRTQGIEESTRTAEGKQRLVRELTGFVKNLSKVNDTTDLFECLYQEAEKFSGLSNPSFIDISSGREGRMMWMETGTLHEKLVGDLPETFSSLAIRVATPNERKWFEKVNPASGQDFLIIPIRGRETQSLAALLIVTFEEGQISLDTLMERISERIQPVSVVLDRIRLHEQLEAAAGQWEATFNGFNDPIAIVDSQERVIRANKTFFKTGKSRCHEMLNDSSQVCSGCPMFQAIEQNTPHSGVVKTAMGQTYQVHSFPVATNKSSSRQSERTINYYTNLSQEKRLYMKLVQSEKLAAVGLLAGNIAHELNNPLAGIRTLSQLLLSDLSEGEGYYQDLKEVEVAAARCQGIITNLLSFSDSGSVRIESVNMNNLVDNTLPLLKTALRNHNLQMFQGENLPLVQVNSSELQQVIFNLVNNACQAMDAGGIITIKTWSDGENVMVSVEDSGPGIPEELHGRIFESFFTTKNVGEGTGLGLSVSRSIIEKYGGRLDLTSQVGEGTKFSIVFPISSKEQQ